MSDKWTYKRNFTSGICNQKVHAWLLTTGFKPCKDIDVEGQISTKYSHCKDIDVVYVNCNHNRGGGLWANKCDDFNVSSWQPRGWSVHGAMLGLLSWVSRRSWFVDQRRASFLNIW